MNTTFAGNIRLKETPKGFMIVGFTNGDMKLLNRAARKKFKLKTRKKRVLKRYVRILMDQAVREFLANQGGL